MALRTTIWRTAYDLNAPIAHTPVVLAAGLNPQAIAVDSRPVDG